MVLDVISWDLGVLLEQSSCVYRQLVGKNMMIPWPGDASCTVRYWAIKHVGHYAYDSQRLRSDLSIDSKKAMSQMIFGGVEYRSAQDGIKSLEVKLMREDADYSQTLFWPVEGRSVLVQLPHCCHGLKKKALRLGQRGLRWWTRGYGDSKSNVSLHGHNKMARCMMMNEG